MITNKTLFQLAHTNNNKHLNNLSNILKFNNSVLNWYQPDLFSDGLGVFHIKSARLFHFSSCFLLPCRCCHFKKLKKVKDQKIHWSWSLSKILGYFQIIRLQTIFFISSHGGLKVEKWTDNRTLSISVDQSLREACTYMVP